MVLSSIKLDPNNLLELLNVNRSGGEANLRRVRRITRHAARLPNDRVRKRRYPLRVISPRHPLSLVISECNQCLLVSFEIVSPILRSRPSGPEPLESLWSYPADDTLGSHEWTPRS